MATQRVPCVTAEEYLEFDRHSEHRNEFVFGEIVAMAGGTQNHSRISVDTVVALARRLDSSKCEIFDCTLRVCLDVSTLYAYPDATVVCGESTFVDSRPDTITNPKVVFEVLSPSTRNFDLGDKARMYSRIPSLDEIVLIEQDRARVEHWRRLPNQHWDLGEVEGINAVLSLTSIGCEVPLSEIYRRVHFETTAGTDVPAAS